jgi:hypothetical protein
MTWTLKTLNTATAVDISATSRKPSREQKSFSFVKNYKAKQMTDKIFAQQGHLKVSKPTFRDDLRFSVLQTTQRLKCRVSDATAGSRLEDRKKEIGLGPLKAMLDQLRLTEEDLER